MPGIPLLFPLSSHSHRSRQFRCRASVPSLHSLLAVLSPLSPLSNFLIHLFFDLCQFFTLIFLNFIFLIHFPHYIIGLCRYFFVPLHPNSTALVALDPDMPRRFSLLPSLSLAQRQELKYSRITDYQHDVRSPMSILNQVLCRIG